MKSEGVEVHTSDVVISISLHLAGRPTALETREILDRRECSLW